MGSQIEPTAYIECVERVPVLATRVTRDGRNPTKREPRPGRR